ncbi:hypothetical protein GOP47_0013939 [Adiantum capillus-veneris]|uniref:Protein kinase domain-containing protein n=1 Tax=Adiantum capillus-veneris TaxID=13818 RepID=A0A9D4UQQ8_ADICA|nr:hypothetical protein GOP47_0013939 [Adiantum capillus-veneris]
MLCAIIASESPMLSEGPAHSASVAPLATENSSWREKLQRFLTVGSSRCRQIVGAFDSGQDTKKIQQKMGRTSPWFSVFRVLIAMAACAKVIANDQNESWACICSHTGLVGTQLYTGDEKLGFTECNCPQAGDCLVCPAGFVVDPSQSRNSTCACTNPLFVIVRLVQIGLSNYTASLEKAYLEGLASLLKLSPSQIFPSGRRNGSVILDMYIFSEHPNLVSLTDARIELLQINSTQNGVLWDNSIGLWKLVYVGNASLNLGQSSHSPQKNLDGKLFILILVLCATIAVALLLLSLMILLHKKRKSSKCPPVLWLDDDNSSSGFRTLLSHRSSPIEKFQVYDNTCFSGSTGCMGKRSFKMSPKLGPVLGMVIRQFSFLELQEATGGFCKSNLIGTGGSSSVYKGCLKDGRDVAIKKLNAIPGESLDREFLLEVELLSRLHHFHLVPLVGYCIEMPRRDIERLLVYDYMPNGNLREHLNQSLGKENLNWAARLKIALGAARGLEYLHEAADPRVLHRDLKSSNVLLDAKWRAKVADFGMATIVKELDSNACPSSPAQMMGTFGYFAPEYAMMGRASVKSDVFSFGVVLLELLSGRKPVDKSVPLGQESLVVWALPLLRNGSKLLSEFVDPALKQGLPVDGVQKMAYLAWLCLQMDPESRPNMTFVVQVLATLVPENNVRMSDFGPLMASRDQGLQMLSWARDYSFSRNVNFSLMMSPNLLEECRLSSWHWEDKQITLLDNEHDKEIAHSKKGELARKSLTSTSLSAAEYLERFTAMTSADRMTRSSEEEADLVKPRLEYFWQNNGLLMQQQSPAR